jgi:hypothetical protein
MFKKSILVAFALIFGLTAAIGKAADFGTEEEAKS